MGPYASFLFARPSFLEGVGRIVDFGNTLSQYNESQNGQQADALALYADWRAVGDSIRKATRKYGERHRLGKAGSRRLKRQERSRVEKLPTTK